MFGVVGDCGDNGQVAEVVEEGGGEGDEVEAGAVNGVEDLEGGFGVAGEDGVAEAQEMVVAGDAEGFGGLGFVDGLGEAAAECDDLVEGAEGVAHAAAGVAGDEVEGGAYLSSSAFLSVVRTCPLTGSCGHCNPCPDYIQQKN